MKLRARLEPRGASALAKAFLPTLDKFGKSCTVLAAPEEVCLVQAEVDADGATVCVRFGPGVLFARDTYRVTSRHFNLIAFPVDVGLLLKALRSALSHDADSIDLKLTQKSMLLPGSSEVENKPFLCLTARGAGVNLVQDLPVGKPLSAADIDGVVAAKDVGMLCPFYIDLASAGPRLAAVVDRMKALSGIVQLATCKVGDLHIQVAESSLMLGAQFEGLSVYPQECKSAPDSVDRLLTAEEQLHDSLKSGEAQAVHLQVKHLLKVFNVSQLSQPSQILLGIAAGGGHVHVMYVYRDPSSDTSYDDSIALAFKLPVRHED